jgi:hypothetical protein
MGRPTKYSKEIVAKAEEYLEKYEDHKHAIPSIVGLALVLDLHRDTIREWGNDENKTEFSAILEKINQKQQQVLISKGLTGDFNSNITKLVLGKHGYHDKQDTQHTGKDGGPITTSTTFIGIVPED